MCECYKIGGPYIAEDPKCPIHGHEARIRDNEEKDLSKRVSNLENKVEELEKFIRDRLKL